MRGQPFFVRTNTDISSRIPEKRQLFCTSINVRLTPSSFHIYQLGWLIVGVISVGIGFGLIWFVGRKSPTAANIEGDNVTLNIDLPGDVNLDSMKCQSCGGVLTMDAIKMVAGAPVVSCPYCNTTYQLSEEPKW